MLRMYRYSFFSKYSSLAWCLLLSWLSLGFLYLSKDLKTGGGDMHLALYNFHLLWLQLLPSRTPNPTQNCAGPACDGWKKGWSTGRGRWHLCVAVLEKATMHFKGITIWARPRSVFPELIWWAQKIFLKATSSICVAVYRGTLQYRFGRKASTF